MNFQIATRVKNNDDHTRRKKQISFGPQFFSCLASRLFIPFLIPTKVDRGGREKKKKMIVRVTQTPRWLT